MLSESLNKRVLPFIRPIAPCWRPITLVPDASVRFDVRRLSHVWKLLINNQLHVRDM